ncbi:TetR/AcrR family transcriptional regulator [Mycolicibacterium fluoranthenivorans]|uniref:AcrR family transcriptional regulator n=1 Tax=Mycolicibacterium fluoranthenivorans TaxID=258505 RepID=A0A7X5ZAH0_9MYCO|nr:TetR/AcrR family transcriptional regulator [Mycolicibacterium fluoranthenivorans]MCV7359314.1 TetR/AcrR family transcriptional regulator [Mycolicibacterium fluoranthenivorans]NIH93599.1 AcrR family transcriptional regulator [Mycolicibacterium fluoranthenivorans]
MVGAVRHLDTAGSGRDSALPNRPRASVRLRDLMMPIAQDAGASRKPLQARSQEKMDRVLAATHDLLIASGPSTITTTAVAARAGVSVGWMYNFFDDRESLLEEVLIQGLVDLDARWDEVGFSLSGADWRTTAAAGIDALIDFLLTGTGIAGFRVLWFSSEFSGRMVQVNRAHDDAVAAYLCNGVSALRADAPDIPLYLMAQTFIGVLDKGFDIAFRADANGDEAALAELRRAALAYLETFLE